jgi:hypothetical protein
MRDSLVGRYLAEDEELSLTEMLQRLKVNGTDLRGIRKLAYV